MNANYFQGCYSVASIKTIYRKLAFQFHPDVNPDIDESFMKEINNQYHAALKSANGQSTTDDDGRRHEYKYNYDVEQSLIDKIRELLSINMENVNIELVGTWIWLSGNTKPYREALKQAKCRWHAKRLMWYYQNSTYKHHYCDCNFDDLKMKYGYQSADNFREQSIVRQF